MCVLSLHITWSLHEPDSVCKPPLTRLVATVLSACQTIAAARLSLDRAAPLAPAPLLPPVHHMQKGSSVAVLHSGWATKLGVHTRQDGRRGQKE